MSAGRAVTVHTDRGPVTIPEPFWCTGWHPGGGHRADIAHEGEEVVLVAETADGPLRVMAANLYQAPFSAIESTGVRVAVEFGELDSAQSHSFTASELAGLADAMVAFAVGPLHELVERLQLLEGVS